MARSRKSPQVGVLTKTFRILQVLQGAPIPLTLKAVSSEAGINDSTAYRFLAHLEKEGWVQRDRKGAYRLGEKLAPLSQLASRMTTLKEYCRPFFWGLSKLTEETVNLAVLEGPEVVFVDGLESPHAFRLVSVVGKRSVFYRTAVGKAVVAHLAPEERSALVASVSYFAFTPKTIITPQRMLEELNRIVEQGYALDDEESYLGLRCLAAPILAGDGQPLAAISVSGPTTRFRWERIPSVAAVVMDAAKEISKLLATRDCNAAKVAKA